MQLANKSRIKLYFSLAISLAIIIYIINSAGLNQIVRHVKQAQTLFLIFPLLLSLLNVSLRFYCWQYMLQSLNYSLSFLRALEHYSTSALFNMVLPARIGNFLRAWIAHQADRIDYADGIGAVLLEGMLALSSLTGLTLLGTFALGYKNILTPLIISCILLLSVIAIIRYERLFNALIGLFKPLKRVKILKKALTNADNVITSLKNIPRPRPLLLVIGSYLTQTAIFWLMLRSLGGQVDYFTLLFAFSASMLIGFLSHLPGGLGAFEGSMSFILTQFGVSAPQAVSAVLLSRIIIRGANLGLGAASFLLLVRELGDNFQLPSWK